MIRYTKEYIQGLLDKYMDGTSTLDEEDILSEYFRGKDIPKEWEDYRHLFQEVEAMKPQKKTNKRWAVWSMAAAAAVTGILYLTTLSQPSDSPVAESLTAQTNTTATQPITQMPDTTPEHKEEVQPVQTKKRRLRKAKPTIHDIDKAYALMAQAEQEQQEAERMVIEARMASLQAYMEAMGYVSVRHEDGTIEYIDENKQFIAYEE